MKEGREECMEVERGRKMEDRRGEKMGKGSEKRKVEEGVGKVEKGREQGREENGE